MDRQDQQNLLEKLLSELADIERQQQDDTLSHSDQQMLDQAWEDVTNKIDELEEILRVAEEEEAVNWQDAAAYLESDSRPRTPVAVEAEWFDPELPRVMTIAPPPPPVLRSITFYGVPPLSETRRPPPIEIPQYTGPTGCPPPPRPAGVSICNCDSDGQCGYCEEEELERWNNMVDDREGCARCSGCAYCQDGGGYDGADEV